MLRAVNIPAMPSGVSRARHLRNRAYFQARHAQLRSAEPIAGDQQQIIEPASDAVHALAGCATDAINSKDDIAGRAVSQASDCCFIIGRSQLASSEPNPYGEVAERLKAAVC